MSQIPKPIQRSSIRRKLGREYFIWKRKMSWWFGTNKWAKLDKTNDFDHIVFKHQSLILRPLKDVDMYLQENKRTNLRFAITHLNSVVIEPGETFRYGNWWAGRQNARAIWKV